VRRVDCEQPTRLEFFDLAAARALAVRFKIAADPLGLRPSGG
jgi:hypothetical protein